MNRSAMRELAFQFLYGAEIQKELNVEQIGEFLENNEIESNDAKKYIEDVSKGILENEKDIKELIEKNLKADWKISRISKVSLTLLKLAIYEINYQKLPYKAIINEVLELAKKYGEEDSHLFINGVLASIVNQK